jgi:microcystin-dependent protein
MTIRLNGSTSGYTELDAPAVAGNNTIVLPSSGTSLAALIPGEVKWFAMNSAPSGFLKANGAAISRTNYANLFAAIGTTFGVGNGSTTFNLPDLRGEFVRGWADDRAVDTGRAFGSAQADELKSHTHTVTDPGHSHTLLAYQATGGGNLAASAVAANAVAPATSTNTTGISIQNTGGTETRPRNVALLACIAF